MIVVVALVQSPELVFQFLEILVRHLLQIHKARACSLVATDQLVQLEMYGLRITVLCVLRYLSAREGVSPPVIRSRIEASLKRAKLGARLIRVETTDGKVTLSGTVRSWAEREEAEKTAWAAEGVAAVENRITVAA